MQQEHKFLFSVIMPIYNVEDYVEEAILSLVNPNLVWISDVAGASQTLESGLVVTIDGIQHLVYEGII